MTAHQNTCARARLVELSEASLHLWESKHASNLGMPTYFLKESGRVWFVLCFYMCEKSQVLVGEPILLPFLLQQRELLRLGGAPGTAGLRDLPPLSAL